MSIKVMKGDVYIHHYIMPNSNPKFIYNKPVYIGSGLGTNGRKDEDISDEDVKDALVKVLPKITKSRLWFAIYRPLVMVGKVKDGMFDAFQDYIENMLDEMPKPIDPHDLQSKMDVQSFHKNIEEWDPSDAPVQGKTFMTYYHLANDFLSLIKDPDTDDEEDHDLDEDDDKMIKSF